MNPKHKPMIPYKKANEARGSHDLISYKSKDLTNPENNKHGNIKLDNIFEIFVFVSSSVTFIFLR